VHTISFIYFRVGQRRKLCGSLFGPLSMKRQILTQIHSLWLAARTGLLDVTMCQSALHCDSALETVRLEALPV